MRIPVQVFITGWSFDTFLVVMLGPLHSRTPSPVTFVCWRVAFASPFRLLLGAK